MGAEESFGVRYERIQLAREDAWRRYRLEHGDTDSITFAEYQAADRLAVEAEFIGLLRDALNLARARAESLALVPGLREIAYTLGGDRTEEIVAGPLPLPDFQDPARQLIAAAKRAIPFLIEHVSTTSASPLEDERGGLEDRITLDYLVEAIKALERCLE